MKITESYNIFNQCINVLELITSLFLLTSKKKEWNEYVICFYGGFLFGIIPFFVIIENILIALIGCIFLSLMLCALQKKTKRKLYIPLEIVMFKTLLIIGISLFDEWYSINKLNYFLFNLFVTVMLFCIFNILYEIPLDKQHYINEWFALLELSGIIIQSYRVDFTYFGKDLYDSKESVSVLFYLLKVDFWIFDYQYLYMACFFALFIAYLVCKKIASYYKK